MNMLMIKYIQLIHLISRLQKKEPTYKIIFSYNESKLTSIVYKYYLETVRTIFNKKDPYEIRKYF